MRNETIYITKVLNIISVRAQITVTASPSTQLAFKNVKHLLNLSQKLMEQQ